MVRFSKGGSEILGASNDGIARIWNVNGNVIQALPKQEHQVKAAHFLRDGSLVLTANHLGIIRVWDRKQRQWIAEWKTAELLPTDHRPDDEYRENIYTLSLAPDESWMVLCSGIHSGTAYVLDLQWDGDHKPDLAFRRKLEHPGSTVSEVAVNWEGTQIAIGCNAGEVFLFDVDDPKEPTNVLVGNAGTVRAIEYSRDDKRILVANTAGITRMFDIDTGSQSASFKGHESGIWGACFSNDPNSTLVATGGHDDKTVKIWPAKSLHEPGLVFACQDDNLAYFVPGTSRIISAGNPDHVVRLVDLQTNRVQEFVGHESPIIDIAASAQSSYIAASNSDGTTIVWNLDGQELHCLTPPPHRLFELPLSDDDAAMLDSGKVPESLEAAFHVQAKTAGPVVTSTGQVGTWEFRYDNIAYRIIREGDSVAVEPIGEITELAISTDERWLVTGRTDGLVRLWNLVSGELERTFVGHAGPVECVAIAPDGTWVVSAAYSDVSHDEMIKWDCGTGELVQKWPTDDALKGLAISPQGDFVAGISWNSRAYVWNAATQDLVHVLVGHTKVSTEITFSAYGSRILTGSWDRVAKLWDTQTGRELLTLETPFCKSNVNSVAISDDGSTILTGCQDGIFLWKSR